VTYSCIDHRDIVGVLGDFEPPVAPIRELLDPASIGDVLDHVLEEFDVATTAAAVEELEETAEYDDLHGAGAAAVLDAEDALTVVDIEGNQFETSRIDVGEASCVAEARELDAAFSSAVTIERSPNCRRSLMRRLRSHRLCCVRWSSVGTHRF